MLNLILHLLIIFSIACNTARAGDLCDAYDEGIQEATKNLKEKNIEAALKSLNKISLKADSCENKKIYEIIENIKSEAKSQKKPNAALNLGYICSGTKICSDQSLQIFTEAAELGSAEAEYVLGLAYKIGRFSVNWQIPKNTERAAYWWNRAAEHGDINAVAYLADLYDGGDGVIQDFQKAINLRRKAAKQGQADAMFGLAMMYADGRGIKKNFRKAYIWYCLANQREIETMGFKNQITIEERDKAARMLSSTALLNAQKEAQRCKTEKYQNCD